MSDGGSDVTFDVVFTLVTHGHFFLTSASKFNIEPNDVYEDRLKIDRSEDGKVFSQVQLYVYQQEHHKYILPCLVVPSIHKKINFLYS